ncbi:MAG TPA: RNA polymerase sigma factor [Woeseiaceae bacterium]|nr:RNA polymerase sigma factor [Woeseiaceae bacterium]
MAPNPAAGGSDDHRLVARVLAHQDTAAYGTLIRRHQSHVRNFLRRLCGDFDLADDLAQDCFLHAWNKLETYTGQGSFIGWLLKVAYTTFLQSKRRSRRYSEVLVEAGHEADATRAVHTLTPELADLDRLLAALTDEERAIMTMSYACGLSHREISEATGHPVGTVKSILFRSKEKLKVRFDIPDHQHG